MKVCLLLVHIAQSLSWSSFQEFSKFHMADIVRAQMNLTDNEAIRSVKLALMYSLVTPFNNLVAAILAETSQTASALNERNSYMYFDKMWTLSELADDSRVQTICEVGFQSGHSALNFLVANPSARFISFDIFEHRQAPAAVRALHEMFLDREVIVVAGTYSSLSSLSFILRFLLSHQCIPLCSRFITEVNEEHDEHVERTMQFDLYRWQSDTSRTAVRNRKHETPHQPYFSSYCDQWCGNFQPMGCLERTSCISTFHEGRSDRIESV